MEIKLRKLTENITIIFDDDDNDDDWEERQTIVL